MKNLRHRTKGFTLVEIMIVVLIIGVLMAIAIPNFLNARATSQKNACIANLKQIQSAEEQYKMDKKTDTLPSSVSGLVATSSDTTLPLKSTPVCPAGGTYTLGDPPTCGAPAALGHKIE